MKYRNVKTGAVIETSSNIRGALWVKIGGEKSEKETITADAPSVAVEEVKPVKKTVKRTTKKKA